MKKMGEKIKAKGRLKERGNAFKWRWRKAKEQRDEKERRVIKQMFSVNGNNPKTSYELKC